jgi:polysaccharide biosynthesis protein PslH
MPSSESPRRRPPQRPRSLLLVAPLWPARGGNGLAMRTGVWLEALAGLGEVTLWVVPVAAGGWAGSDPELATAVARRVVVAPLEEDPRWALARRLAAPEERERALAALPFPAAARFATSRAVAELRAATGAASPAQIVVVRSYLAPFAAPLLARGGADRRLALLDLDDDEASTRRGLVRLHRVRGEAAAAAWEEREAERYTALEARLLPAYDLLATADPAHAATLRGRLGGAAVAVVPNAIDLPRPAPGERSEELRVLLVGNLGYLPNVDGARWLCEEVLPALRARGGRVAVRLAGSSPTAEVLALRRHAGVEVVPDPRTLAPHYAWASVAAVPLRAGGGTRIKVLEAFAHGVPVVATPLGAAGLGAADGVHLRLAADAGAIAAACAELHADPVLAGRLVAAAAALAERHRRERVIAAIRRLLRPATDPV